MNRMISAAMAGLTALTLFTGLFGEKGGETRDFCFFPMFSASPAIEFEEPEISDGRIEVVEQKEEVQVKFRLVEWLLSVF